MQALKERITSEVYIHTGLGIFFTLLTLELSIGMHGAWSHFNISWLKLIGWIFYVPSAILVFGAMIELKRKGKTETYDPTSTTSFVDTGIYRIIRQPITLGIAVWSIALIFVFQSVLSIVLGLLVIFCCWMSARQEGEYNTKKFGDRYKEYMRKVPMWNIFKCVRKLK